MAPQSKRYRLVGRFCTVSALVVAALMILPVASANPYPMTVAPVVVASNNSVTGSPSWSDAYYGLSAYALSTSTSTYGITDLGIYDNSVASASQYQGIQAGAGPFHFGGSSGTWTFTGSGTLEFNSSAYEAEAYCNGASDAASASVEVYWQIQLWDLGVTPNTLLLNQHGDIWYSGLLTCSGSTYSSYSTPAKDGTWSTSACTTSCSYSMVNGHEYNLFLAVVCQATATITSDGSTTAAAFAYCGNSGSYTNTVYVTSITAT